MSPHYDMRGSQYSNGYNSDQHSENNEDGPTFLLEHLATFSVGPQFGLVSSERWVTPTTTEKSNAIWTQKMQMRLEKKWVVIIDYENGDVVERFPMSLIGDPTSYTSNDPRELYNNILVFVVREDPKTKSHAPAEMHIFQCLRVSAQDVVDEMKLFVSGKRKSGYRESVVGPQGPLPPEPTPSNGGPSVREQVSMFNAAAAAPPTPAAVQGHRIDRPSAYARDTSNDETSSTNSDKYERDVAILNHCFDDIERFIARLQHAAAAYKELDRRRKTRKSKKKDMGDGMLSMRAKPPPEREFVDILQKFKLSFNLLAKLKSHIHDPNAPELVHFLFTPLALIVDAARDSNYGPNLAAKVTSPLLTRDAVDLLSNCCTSKENDLWLSLGDPWTLPREQWKGYNTAYHPVFSDGWAPEYPFSEDRERAELTASAAATTAQKVRRDEIRRAQEEAEMREHEYRSQQHGRGYGGVGGVGGGGGGGGSDYYYGSESPEQHYDMERRDYAERASEFSNDSIEHMDPDRHQQQWLDDLKARGSKVVQVMYPRTANNDKELTVVRGEFLEVLDDTRKWWKARNIRGQIAHVPHTIVAPFATEEDIFNNPLYAARSGGPRETYYSPSESARGEAASPDGHRPPPAPASAEWVRRERQGKKDSQNTPHRSEPNPGEKSLPAIPAPPPPPPPIPTTNEKAPQSLRPVLKKTPSLTQEEPVDQARDLLHEELKERVTLHPRLRKKWAPVHHHGSYLTAESSINEVQQWLMEKDFGTRTQQVCRDLNGRMMFALTRSQLEKFLGSEEGSRLASHLTVQKNISGFKSSKEHELSSVLEARRNRMDHGFEQPQDLSHEKALPSAPLPQDNHSESEDEMDPDVASKTLRVLLRDQRRKIMTKN